MALVRSLKLCAILEKMSIGFKNCNEVGFFV